MKPTEVQVSVEGKFISETEFQIDTLMSSLLHTKRQALSRMTVNLQNEILRKALIELGWTPPTKDKELL